MKNSKELKMRSSGSLPAEMKKEDVNETGIKANDIKPFKLIPNVRRFRIELSDWDKLFEEYNLKRRESKAKLVFEKYINNRLNKYILHQLKRMRKASPLLYWRIAMHLIRRSNIFFTMALNHVYPNWHREMSVTRVVKLAVDTRKIANIVTRKLDYKRVYLDEGHKIRPLGVPSPAWRVYLHMLNQVLVYYFECRDLFHPDQHGYRPNRGTLTAWEVVLESVIKSKDILEFDLKGFFDSVNLDYISKKLIEKEVPVNIVHLLYYINTCAVKVKPPYLLNEFESMMKQLLHRGASMDEVVKAPRPIGYMYRVRGVPQGAPTSPVLASLALEGSVLDRGVGSVMYADDGLYYGDLWQGGFTKEELELLAIKIEKDEEFEEVFKFGQPGYSRQPLLTPNSNMVSANIRFNLKKTKWVKKNGIWLDRLKFLGLEYDGVEDKLYGSTRGGSKLEFDKKELTDKLARREFILNFGSKGKKKDTFKSEETWENLVKSKVFGFMQSRMYTGSWSNEEIEQCFDFTYTKDSLMGRRKKLLKKAQFYFTIFNASSVASNWLVSKLRKLKHPNPYPREVKPKNNKVKAEIVVEKVDSKPKEEVKRIIIRHESNFLKMNSYDSELREKRWQMNLKEFFNKKVEEKREIDVIREYISVWRKAIKSWILSEGIIRNSLREILLIGLSVNLVVLLGCLIPKPRGDNIVELITLQSTAAQYEWQGIGLWLIIVGLLILIFDIIRILKLEPASESERVLEGVHGPLTYSEWSNLQSELYNQALLDNLAISPIGALWELPW